MGCYHLYSGLFRRSSHNKRNCHIVAYNISAAVLQKGGVNMAQLKEFERFLKRSNLSENTVTSYLWTVDWYIRHYGEIEEGSLLEYKGYLVENFKPKTVNLRIQGMNKYLAFTGHGQLQLKAVKIQQKNFLENVISNADYQFLKKKLKSDGNTEWYFVVWYLAATGALRQ